MKPFLKWAGGKRWLVNRMPDLFAVSFRRYVEPFLGGGAVYFHLEPKKAILSDRNPALINLYEALRSDWRSVESALRAHASLHSDDYYYEVRDQKPRSLIKQAARFLYLNRTCFNGLYRENQNGKFNVPRGTKDTVIFDDDDFEKVSNILQGSKLLAADFELILSQIRDQDLVFVDPPYTVKHNTNGFIRYNESLFSWSDQERLAKILRKKAECGAKIVLTNANHPSVTDLYKEFSQVVTVGRSSVLSGEAAYRGQTDEALILIGMTLDDVLGLASSTRPQLTA